MVAKGLVEVHKVLVWLGVRGERCLLERKNGNVNKAAL
jgi:hypothetical protein